VRVRSGRVVAEQSLAFTSENETRRGITLSLGATAPARSWTLPAFAAGDGAANSVFVANFGTVATEVEVAPRFEDESAVAPSTVAVPGRSAEVVDLGPLVDSGVAFDVQVRATGSAPVVAERFGAWGQPSGTIGSATALGSTVRARDWVFAWGRLTADDAAVVSVFNPNRSETTVRLLGYQADGDQPASRRELNVAAGKQGSFDLRELNIPPDQVLVVRARLPVVAALRVLGPSGASVAPGVPDPHAS
jgi:hypothetical protein